MRTVKCRLVSESERPEPKRRTGLAALIRGGVLPNHWIRVVAAFRATPPNDGGQGQCGTPVPSPPASLPRPS